MYLILAPVQEEFPRLWLYGYTQALQQLPTTEKQGDYKFYTNTISGETDMTSVPMKVKCPKHYCSTTISYEKSGRI